ncbi:hypothetical protein N2152v2_002590 [Parachlorella kessleri]
MQPPAAVPKRRPPPPAAATGALAAGTPQQETSATAAAAAWDAGTLLPSLSFDPKNLICAYNEKYWYRGEVVEVDASKDPPRVKVAFRGYPSSDDTWLDSTSDRLATYDPKRFRSSGQLAYVVVGEKGKQGSRKRGSPALSKDGSQGQTEQQQRRQQQGVEERVGPQNLSAEAGAAGPAVAGKGGSSRGGPATRSRSHDAADITPSSSHNTGKRARRQPPQQQVGSAGGSPRSRAPASSAGGQQVDVAAGEAPAPAGAVAAAADGCAELPGQQAQQAVELAQQAVAGMGGPVAADVLATVKQENEEGGLPLGPQRVGTGPQQIPVRPSEQEPRQPALEGDSCRPAWEDSGGDAALPAAEPPAGQRYGREAQQRQPLLGQAQQAQREGQRAQQGHGGGRWGSSSSGGSGGGSDAGGPAGQASSCWARGQPAGPFVALYPAIEPWHRSHPSHTLAAALLLHGALSAGARSRGHAAAWPLTRAFLRSVLAERSVALLESAAAGCAAAAAAVLGLPGAWAAELAGHGTAGGSASLKAGAGAAVSSPGGAWGGGSRPGSIPPPAAAAVGVGDAAGLAGMFPGPAAAGAAGSGGDETLPLQGRRVVEAEPTVGSQLEHYPDPEPRRRGVAGEGRGGPGGQPPPAPRPQGARKRKPPAPAPLPARHAQHAGQPQQAMRPAVGEHFLALLGAVKDRTSPGLTGSGSEAALTARTAPGAAAAAGAREGPWDGPAGQRRETRSSSDRKKRKQGQPEPPPPAQPLARGALQVLPTRRPLSSYVMGPPLSQWSKRQRRTGPPAYFPAPASYPGGLPPPSFETTAAAPSGCGGLHSGQEVSLDPPAGLANALIQLAQSGSTAGVTPGGGEAAGQLARAPAPARRPRQQAQQGARAAGGEGPSAGGSPMAGKQGAGAAGDALAAEWAQLQQERRAFEEDQAELRGLVNAFAAMLLPPAGSSKPSPALELVAADPAMQKSLRLLLSKKTLRSLLSKVLNGESNGRKAAPAPSQQQRRPSGASPPTAQAGQQANQPSAGPGTVPSRPHFGSPQGGPGMGANGAYPPFPTGPPYFHPPAGPQHAQRGPYLPPHFPPPPFKPQGPLRPNTHAPFSNGGYPTPAVATYAAALAAAAAAAVGGGYPPAGPGQYQHQYRGGTTPGGGAQQAQQAGPGPQQGSMVNQARISHLASHPLGRSGGAGAGPSTAEAPPGSPLAATPRSGPRRASAAAPALAAHGGAAGVAGPPAFPPPAPGQQLPPHPPRQGSYELPLGGPQVPPSRLKQEQQQGQQRPPGSLPTSPSAVGAPTGAAAAASAALAGAQTGAVPEHRAGPGMGGGGKQAAAVSAAPGPWSEDVVARVAAALLSGEVTKEELLAQLQLPDSLCRELRQAGGVLVPCGILAQYEHAKPRRLPAAGSPPAAAPAARPAGTAAPAAWPAGPAVPPPLPQAAVAAPEAQPAGTAAGAAAAAKAAGQVQEPSWDGLPHGPPQNSRPPASGHHPPQQQRQQHMQSQQQQEQQTSQHAGPVEPVQSPAQQVDAAGSGGHVTSGAGAEACKGSTGTAGTGVAGAGTAGSDPGATAGSAPAGEAAAAPAAAAALTSNGSLRAAQAAAAGSAAGTPPGPLLLSQLIRGAKCGDVAAASAAAAASRVPSPPGEGVLEEPAGSAAAGVLEMAGAASAQQAAEQQEVHRQVPPGRAGPKPCVPGQAGQQAQQLVPPPIRTESDSGSRGQGCPAIPA